MKDRAVTIDKAQNQKHDRAREAGRNKNDTEGCNRNNTGTIPFHTNNTEGQGECQLMHILNAWFRSLTNCESLKL
jgi:hypothetical protein